MEHPLAHERLLEKISRQELDEFIDQNNGKKIAKAQSSSLESWSFKEFTMHIVGTENFTEDRFNFKVAFSGDVSRRFIENIIALNQQHGWRDNEL